MAPIFRGSKVIWQWLPSEGCSLIISQQKQQTDAKFKTEAAV